MNIAPAKKDGGSVVEKTAEGYLRDMLWILIEQGFGIVVSDEEIKGIYEQAVKAEAANLLSNPRVRTIRNLDYTLVQCRFLVQEKNRSVFDRVTANWSVVDFQVLYLRLSGFYGEAIHWHQAVQSFRYRLRWPK